MKPGTAGEQRPIAKKSKRFSPVKHHGDEFIRLHGLACMSPITPKTAHTHTCTHSHKHTVTGLPKQSHPHPSSLGPSLIFFLSHGRACIIECVVCHVLSCPPPESLFFSAWYLLSARVWCAQNTGRNSTQPDRYKWTIIRCDLRRLFGEIG